MPRLNQMPCRVVSTFGVSDQDGVALPSLGYAIDTYDRHCIGSIRLQKIGGISAGSRDDQKSSNMVRAQFPNVRCLLLRVIIRVAQDHAERALVSYVLHASNYPWEKRIRDVRNHHPEHVRAIATKSS